MNVPSISQTFSGVSQFVPAFAYGIPTLGIQPLFMITPCVDLVTVRITILLVALGIMMSFDE